MSTEHTPGPWTANARGYKSQVWNDGQMMTAEVLGPNHAANARLMAAAPDLLAALRSATFALESAVMLAGLHALAEPAANARAALNRFYGEETDA